MNKTKEQKSKQRLSFKKWYVNNASNPMFRTQRQKLLHSKYINQKTEIKRQQLELQTMSKTIEQQAKQISELESELNVQGILVEELRSAQKPDYIVKGGICRGLRLNGLTVLCWKATRVVQR